MSLFEENRNEDSEKVCLPPDFPGLDYPIESDDSMSAASSELGIVETIKFSTCETLIAGKMLCVSEPDSEASGEEENVSVVLPSKNHPDNQSFVHMPVEGSNLTMGSITDEHDLNQGTMSYLKRNSTNTNTKEGLCFKISIDDHEETSQQTVNFRIDKVFRRSYKNICYNEQSGDDGDFSATEGSDYVCDSDEESNSTHDTKICFTKRDMKTTSRVRVTIPETPEKSIEEDNASQQPIFSNESIEKDHCKIHLDVKIHRSSNVTTNFDHNNDDVNLNVLVQNILENTDAPLKSTRQRSWNRRNYCLYCENLVTNFTRHLIRNHPNEVDVLKLMAINGPNPKEQKKKRQAITDDLRNRGNYIHNSQVVSGNEGFVIPARRKNDEELTKSPSSFVVCKKCLGTYRRSTFYRHSKKCNPDSENDSTIKRILARHALGLIPLFTNASKEFQENILPKLRNDEISLIVKQDPLIIAYGCRLLKKKKERRSRKSICSKMRDLANLLKILREKNPEIAQLQNLFNPKYYENFIEAVKEMSGFNEETGYVRVISIPARIRPEILGCIEILFTNTIMDTFKSTALKDHIKNQLSEFKLLLEANWQWEISTNAEKTRKRNLMTKSQIMPLEQDIEKVMIQIHYLEEKYYKSLKKDTTNVNYENLCEVTIAHIILLDRKRSGDVAEAELQYYLNRKTDEIPPQVLETLDNKQKQAISDLDIFQIPGKRGRSVPILLTKIMSRNINVLIACRSTLNISSKNKYLFARPLTEEPFDGGRCLNKIKNMCDLKKPEMLTSTGLRHHIATISQVDAKTNDKYTQHLATFLGHDMHVHNSNYRLPLQAIQKGIVGSRLLDVENYNKHQEESNETQSESDMSDVGDKANEKDVNNVTEIDECHEVKDKDNVLQPKKGRKGKKVVKPKRKVPKTARNKWSSAEIEAVMRHLKKYILLKKCPGKAKCEEVLRKEAVLHNRTWMQINTYINNIYKKNL